MTIALRNELKTVPILKQNILTALISGTERAPLKPFENGWRRYGDLYYFQIGNFPIPILSHPAYAQEVFVTQRDVFQKMGHSPRGDVLSLVLGQGLITNHDTESWLSQRRMIQPLFHKKRLAVMSEKMAQAGERMLERWSDLEAGTTLDINHEMMTLTMDIVLQTMFSSDMMAKANLVGHSINEALHFAFSQRGLVRWPMSWPLPQNIRFKKAMKVLDETVYELIDGRRGHESDFDDLLSMLMEARDEETGQGMSREQLRDEVASFFGAGHETTSHALTWTLYLLSQNREALVKLQAEVDRVLNGRSPAFADLPNLPYTKMVFEESLRLFPPVPIVPRYSMTETEIDGFPIPKGAVNLTSVWNIHRHPDIWQDPEAFMPERFGADQVKGRHRLAFMPFGAGQRLCIGNNFALYEGQMLLALMVQKFNFQLKPGYEPELNLAITLKPKHGLPMIIWPRN